MKALYFACVTALIFSAVSVQAQKQAQLDNNARISCVRAETVTGRTHEIHYTLTNISSVSMDFTLYKQLTNGSWDITHHLDLAPGAVYNDVSGFTSVTGKYVVFSAPHSDWASFPSQFDIDKALASAPAGAPTSPPPGTTVTTPVANTTPPPATATQSNGAPAYVPPPPPPPKDNTQIVVPPPM